MMDRTGFFAAFADLMTEMCAYYVAIGVMFMAGHDWRLSLGWILLCTAVCAVFFRLLLRRARGVPLLTAITVALFGILTYAFWRLAGMPAAFGHKLALALGAGMAVGLSLYHCLRRPPMLSHLTHLDAQLLLLLILLLFAEAHAVAPGAPRLLTAVLLLDAAACVGLRMSDGGGADSGDALRASLLALAAAAVLALLILLALAVFSRSGSVTGAVLRGIGAALSAVWDAVERFAYWLVSLFGLPEEAYAPAALAPASGEMADYSNYRVRLPVNTTVLGVLLCLLVLAAAVAVARQLRRARVAAETGRGPSEVGVRTRRRGGVAGMLWERFRAAMRFSRAAFRHRDTPGGVLVWLERRSRRRMPRGKGESMRAFLRRLAPDGGLEELADALDREYYGGGPSAMSPRRCRELRREGRRLLRSAGKAP